MRIIRPRVEEILELARDRLPRPGFRAERRAARRADRRRQPAHRAAEAARRILGAQVRIGRPLGVQGLPESAKSPAFAAAVGLLIYPQVAGLEYFEPQPRRAPHDAASDGYVGRGAVAEEKFLNEACATGRGGERARRD